MVQIPHGAFWKNCFTFSIIFIIILLYFIEIKTQYCSSEKLNIFFPSAARRIRTGDLQGGVDVFRSQTSKCSPLHYSSVCKWLEQNILMQHMDCEIILEARPASINPLSCSVYDYLLIPCSILPLTFPPTPTLQHKVLMGVGVPIPTTGEKA